MTGRPAGPAARPALSQAGRTAGRRQSGGRRQAAPRLPATDQPVARVAVDVPLPHLDRLFDYLVPQAMAQAAVAGCRVRVRFSGRLVSGYVVERAQETAHEGKLAFLERVVSPEPVLVPEVAGLARAVADRYGGTLADVLRLAIPPRHGGAEAVPAQRAAAELDAAEQHTAEQHTAEQHTAEQGAAEQDLAPGVAESGDLSDEAGPWSGLWARYPTGPSFLAALSAGRSPRAVWAALPGQDWPAEIAQAVAAVAASGRGALVIVPDARDLALVDAALSSRPEAGAHVSLSAQLGPAERYRRWLAVRRGQVKIVAGTRSAMFAPVADLGLVVIWDDGDDLHGEPRAPYPHARDVLALRAHRCGAAALIGGFARTAEAAQLIATGWARPLGADRQVVRQHAPLVRVAGEDAELERDEAARTARMPGLALRTAREALAAGPVLFQVPRTGYLAAVACQHCGARVRCGACGGPAALTGPGQPLRCGWCGSAGERSCAACGSTSLRALITGTRRTAEELGHAFPGVTVRTSSGSDVLASVPPSAAVVIATPGAEPLVAGGYVAAVLLDSWALLGRPSLRAAEEALRRWMNAAALVRPGPHGGKVVLMADPGLAAVQALIRWDAGTHADRELAERRELRFPPSVRIAALTGPGDLIRDILASVALPDGADVLGPVPVDHRVPDAEQAPDQERFLIRVAASAGTELAIALRSGLAERTARKEPGIVRLQLDPAELI